MAKKSGPEPFAQNLPSEKGDRKPSAIKAERGRKNSVFQCHQALCSGSWVSVFEDSAGRRSGSESMGSKWGKNPSHPVADAYRELFCLGRSLPGYP
jgi:hypothetical protein